MIILTDKEELIISELQYEIENIEQVIRILAHQQETQQKNHTWLLSRLRDSKQHLNNIIKEIKK